MIKNIVLPLTDKIIPELKLHQELTLSGTIYTARDIAHLKLVEFIKNKKKIPFKLNYQTIYYCGPTKSAHGQIIGSCGPTTSVRMDRYTPLLLEHGLKGMIGKGPRSIKVVDAIKKYHAVYFITYWGAGAYLNQFVKKTEVVAFEEFGTEAILKLEIENFPVFVSII